VIVSVSQVNAIARTTAFDPTGVEKVLRLKELLTEFWRHPFLQGKLVLKGGTAINVFLFRLPRLSVDVDLNYIGQADRQAMISERPRIEAAVRHVCTALRYRLQSGTDEYAVREFYLSFRSVTGTGDRIQPEVNFLMRICALQPVLQSAVRLANEPEIQFPVLAAEELMGSKLKALLDRRHPGDLYDAFRFLTSEARYDRELLRKLAVLFASTLDRDLREYQPERYESIEQADLERFLYPLLRATDRPTAPEMLRAVAPLLRDVLDYDREKAYLEAMARGKYEPELLSSDYPEVAQRIAGHPASCGRRRTLLHIWHDHGNRDSSRARTQLNLRV
jgi:predicted nucleotidyltransferase component of viral defense system